MKSIGIEELEANVSQALAEVRAGETIEITEQRQAVAILMPAPPDIDERRASLAQLDELRKEIGKHLSGPIDVTEILREMRRY